MRLRVILALLQIAIFIAIAVFEHNQSLARNRKDPDPAWEAFGCLLLERRPMAEKDRQEVWYWNFYECRGGSLPVRLVNVMDLPAMIASVSTTRLHAPYQRPVFYGTSILLIGAWWYLIGMT